MESHEQKPLINDHNKDEYPPMHTAEHILNGGWRADSATAGPSAHMWRGRNRNSTTIYPHLYRTPT